MRGVCTTCMGMCGNGVWIGMTPIPGRLPIPQVLQVVRTVCRAAAAGVAAPGIAVRRTATTTPRRIATTTLGYDSVVLPRFISPIGFNTMTTIDLRLHAECFLRP